MYSVLLVEDDPLIADLYKTALEIGEYKVLMCGKGNLVEEQVRHEKPDLIMLDLMMPDKSGMDVLKDLKADEVLKKIPIVIFSNLVDEQKTKEALAAGAIRYAVKNDYPPRAFLNLIAEVLEEETKKAA